MRRIWRALRYLCQRILGEIDTTKAYVNHLTKSVKKSFVSSKQAYVEYIDFCNGKHLELPANQAELDELIDTTEDALLNPIIHFNYSDLKRLIYFCS